MLFKPTKLCEIIIVIIIITGVQAGITHGSIYMDTRFYCFLWASEERVEHLMGDDFKYNPAYVKSKLLDFVRPVFCVGVK